MCIGMLLTHCNSCVIVDKCQKGEVNLKNSFAAIVQSLIEIAGNIAPTLEMSEQAFRFLTQLAEIPFRQPQVTKLMTHMKFRNRLVGMKWVPDRVKQWKRVFSDRINFAQIVS